MKEHNRGQTYQCCDGVGARSNEKMGKENNNTKGGHCGRGFPSRNREACKNLTSLVNCKIVPYSWSLWCVLMTGWRWLWKGKWGPVQRALKDVLRCVDFIQEAMVSHGST